METVNKVYHAASHAVWGEEDEERKSGEEPVSGETGQGTATDPYDAGNMEGMGSLSYFISALHILKPKLMSMDND